MTLYAKFGRSYDDLRVQFRVDGQNVIDRPFDNHAAADGLQLPQGLADQEKLIVALGGSVGVEEAVRLHQQSTGVQVVIANLGGDESLPTHWYGYDGVDWLVISTGQPDRLQAMFDTAARRAALKEWIENGGKLLFTAGTEGAAVFAQDAPLRNSRRAGSSKRRPCSPHHRPGKLRRRIAQSAAAPRRADPVGAALRRDHRSHRSRRWQSAARDPIAAPLRRSGVRRGGSRSPPVSRMGGTWQPELRD